MLRQLTQKLYRLFGATVHFGQQSDPSHAIKEQPVPDWYERGLALRRAGDREAALECFREAVEFRHDDVNALVNQGEILFELGRREDAADYFEHALAFAPDHIPALVGLARLRRESNAPIEYLKWYYTTNVWKRLCYRGVRTLKLPLDMWNYQELIFENDIHWVLETGTRHGGSALFFADLLTVDAREGKVVSVDVTHVELHSLAATHPRIRLLLGDSTNPTTIAQIQRLIPNSRSHGLLLILDSDHSRSHVLQELNALVPLLRQGDYLIVEDTIVNGHPVRPDFGPGPLEAVEAYLAANPAKLVPDAARESKFGCTFAFRGYYKVFVNE